MWPSLRGNNALPWCSSTRVAWPSALRGIWAICSASSASLRNHGSLSRETRLLAEQRLKAGDLTVLVATASLELGLDIGDVDLVCQLGSPRSIAMFLQRAGRSGQKVGGTPKARLFAQTRDELVECAALLDSVRRGELDALRIPLAPIDVLAQQIVAEAACED